MLDAPATVVKSKATVYIFGQIQTSQAGGQPRYSDTSPYGECSLVVVMLFNLPKAPENNALI